MGEGLFSSISYKEGVCYYVGEEISSVEAERRTTPHNGGYAHAFSATRQFWCYDKYKDGKCMGSYANSNTACRYHGQPEKRVIANCKLRVDTRSRKVALVCRVNYIPPNTELITSYGDGYIYPGPLN